MATKSLFGLDQSTKEEVSSWIQNEQQCVTAHRIAQTMMVSRSEASLLLQEIVQDERFPCEITTCRQLKEDDNNDKVRTTGKIHVLRVLTRLVVPMDLQLWFFNLIVGKSFTFDC